MDHQQEASALGEIQERLADRFPGIASEVIEAAVRLAHAELRGPVRDYVPLLVEHAAHDRLRVIAVASPAEQPQSQAVATPR
ncbi:hypothetical protein ABEG17_16700 [Pedococcus sp. KACC 23699]|uniref:DUF3562 domain-containing protein n=1 Tax=Pedococcus sp. KACC 23699 TaxID=3149228 RepID=A0AAU7JSY1_9MICO